MKPLEKELKHRIGLNCYGSDKDNLASVVLALLRKEGETLSVAESCTGGGIGACISSVEGASDVFLGGVIAYSNYTKQTMLNVNENLIEKYGAVSAPVVEAMAKGIQEKLQTDWAIAISGIAGPTGATKDKSVGCVEIGISGPNSLKSISINFGPHRRRTQIQELSVVRALDEIRIILLNKH